MGNCGPYKPCCCHLPPDAIYRVSEYIPERSGHQPEDNEIDKSVQRDLRSEPIGGKRSTVDAPQMEEMHTPSRFHDGGGTVGNLGECSDGDQKHNHNIGQDP